MKPALVCLCVTLALAMAGPASAKETLSCPQTVRMKSADFDPESVPDGYRAQVSASPVRLSGVGMYDGPPEQGAALVPRIERSTKLGSTAEWRFAGDYPQGKFIACDYGNGVMQLVARVGDSNRACIATTNVKRPQGVMTAVFTCM